MESVSDIWLPTHDWTVDIGSWRFGIEGFPDVSFIHFGPFTTSISFSAPTILGITTAALLVLTLAVAYVVTHFRAKPDKGA